MARGKVVEKPVEVEVACSGEVHRIRLTEKGDLVLLDHPDLESELVLSALTGEWSPGCPAFLGKWREGYFIPMGPKVYGAIARRNEERRKARKASDPLEEPLEVRLGRRATSLAEKALKSCDYRRSPERHSDFALVHPDYAPSISGIGYPDEPIPGSFSSITLKLPPRWLKVYKRGLATALDPEGKRVFVLDILEEDPLVVLAGKQGKGFRVHPQRARAFREGEDWRLEWLEK